MKCRQITVGILTVLLLVFLVNPVPVAAAETTTITDFSAGSWQEGLSVGADVTLLGAQAFNWWNDIPNHHGNLEHPSSGQFAGFIVCTAGTKLGDTWVNSWSTGTVLTSGGGDYWGRSKWGAGNGRTCKHRVYIDGTLQVEGVGSGVEGGGWIYREASFSFSTSDNAVDFDGRVWWSYDGSASQLRVGELWVRVYPKSRIYTSQAISVSGLEHLDWRKATWTENLPSGTEVELKFRGSDDALNWGSWTAWHTNDAGSTIDLGGFYTYIQFEAKLSRTSNTESASTLSDVTLEYSTTYPSVKSVETDPTTVTAEQPFSVKVTATDPNADITKVQIKVDGSYVFEYSDGGFRKVSGESQVELITGSVKSGDLYSFRLVCHKGFGGITAGQKTASVEATAEDQTGLTDTLSGSFTYQYSETGESTSTDGTNGEDGTSGFAVFVGEGSTYLWVGIGAAAIVVIGLGIWMYRKQGRRFPLKLRW